MRLLATLSPVLSLLLVINTSGCEDTSGPEPGLYDGGVRALVRDISAPAIGPIFGSLPANSNVQRPPAPSSPLEARQIAVDHTMSCPGGGTIRTQGILAGQLSGGGSGALVADLYEMLTSCVLTLEEKTYTVSSVPHLDLTGAVALQNGSAQEAQTLFLRGPLSVRGERGPAFSCTLDLSVAVAVSSRSAVVTGTACGVPVDVPISWTPA